MIRFAVIGVDHRHIYEQTGRLLELGCECAGFWTEGNPEPLAGFLRRFPDLKRVETQEELLEDSNTSLIVTAAIPCDRARIAILSMEHGKDVMTDKPGCISLEQLEMIKQTAKKTGRIWSVNFSERFEVRAVQKAIELVKAGRIGRVVQTLGMGPHRLNHHLRPKWFFDPFYYGGVITDIASHQIDQFLVLSGMDDAEIVSSTVANYANPDDPGLEDFGEVVLRNKSAHGYIRVDWYTPDGMPVWGDGRLFITGSNGSIELRKYVDVEGRPGGDHLFVTDQEKTEYIDCSDAKLTYYSDLIQDVLNRSETAMSIEHPFKVMELSIRAQNEARRLGNLL